MTAKNKTRLTRAVTRRDDRSGFHGTPLLDYLVTLFGVKTDFALCERLDVSPPIISKIRNGHTTPSAGLLIRIHEETDMPFSAMRELMQQRPAARTGKRQAFAPQQSANL